MKGMIEDARARYVPHGRRARLGYDAAVQRNQETERAAARRRETNPVERAKVYLQRRGVVCFSAHVIGLGAGTIVGRSRRLLSDAELIDMARRWGLEPCSGTRA